MTNSVYKSLQDNNEEQCIILLGESGAGKTENNRMIINFLSKVSGKFIPLQRQPSSNSVESCKSSTNSPSSTPKHKSSALLTALQNDKDKLSCFRTDNSRNKKNSRVEFDFSYQRCSSEDETIQFCTKHNPSQIATSSSTKASNMLETTKQKSTSNDFSLKKRSLNCVHVCSKTLNCLNYEQNQNKCESLEPKCPYSESNVKENDNFFNGKDKKVKSSNTHLFYHSKNIDLDVFKKNAKRKLLPKKSSLNINSKHDFCFEIQNMRERIAQAETFLEAMGHAATFHNRDSSRYV